MNAMLRANGGVLSLPMRFHMLASLGVMSFSPCPSLFQAAEGDVKRPLEGSVEAPAAKKPQPEPAQAAKAKAEEAESEEEESESEEESDSDEDSDDDSDEVNHYPQMCITIACG